MNQKKHPGIIAIYKGRALKLQRFLFSIVISSLLDPFGPIRSTVVGWSKIYTHPSARVPLSSLTIATTHTWHGYLKEWIKQFHFFHASCLINFLLWLWFVQKKEIEVIHKATKRSGIKNGEIQHNLTWYQMFMIWISYSFISQLVLLDLITREITVEVLNHTRVVWKGRKDERFVPSP